MSPASASGRVRFGDFVVDLDSFELRKHGIRLKLQDQPFQILKLLLQRPSQLVTREELRLQLWTESTFVDFDAGLNAAIRRLRDALNDSADEPRYVETVPRHGYRFIAKVEPLEKQQPAFIPSDSGELLAGSAESATREVWVQSPIGPETSRSNTLRSRTILLAALIVILLLGVGSSRWRSKAYAKRSAIQTRSIAVLPFDNLSENASEQYFADAMTDALITNLSQVGALQVTSRTSVMQYKNARPALPQIARDLHVDLVIEGTVVRSGNRVRISAQMIEANSDRHIWAQRYDRELTDILSIQADVATRIASEVQSNLTPQERDHLAQARPVNPEAYEAYVKAKYFYKEDSPEGQKKAKEYYTKSLNLDPTFAPAYTGLAENLAYQAYVRTYASADWMEAEQLTKKSLELDPNSAPTHTLLGMILWQFHCDTEGAEKEFALALQLNPGDMFTRDYYSYYLLMTGHHDEAIQQKREVLSRDPVSVRTNAELGLYYLEAGLYDQAIAQLKQALELDPNSAPAHMRLGLAYQGKGQYDLAIVQMKKGIELDATPQKYERLGFAYALAGRRKEALEVVDLLKNKRSPDSETAVGVALIYAHVGEKEKALAWLDRAKPGDVSSLSDPGFDTLREDPRFKKIQGRWNEKQGCSAN